VGKFLRTIYLENQQGAQRITLISILETQFWKYEMNGLESCEMGNVKQSLYRPGLALRVPRG